MSDVVVSMKIMPEGLDINLDHLQKELDSLLVSYGRIYKHTRTPVAFGLVSLDYSIIMPQKEGGTDPMEHAIRKIHGVGDIQIMDVTLALDVKDLASKK